jgi:protein HOOK3
MVAESSVLNWVNTFDLEDPVATLEELADGVVLHRILREIAPAHFPDGALKDNCGSNAILRTTNIKKLLRALEGYYRDVLLQDLHSGYVDPEQVAQADATEVSKLVELVLGCAVQCDDKQRYIQRLMKDLDKQSQADIMVLSRLLAPRATRMAASPYAVVPCLGEWVLACACKQRLLILPAHAGASARAHLLRTCRRIHVHTQVLTKQCLSRGEQLAIDPPEAGLDSTLDSEAGSQVAELQAALRKLQIQMEDLEGSKAELQGQLATALEKKDELQLDLTEALEQRTKYEKMYNDLLEDSMKASARQSTMVSSEQASLEMRLAEAEAELVAMRGKLAEREGLARQKF